MAIQQVRFSRGALKSLKRVPVHIIQKLDDWAVSVTKSSLEKVRMIPGYHDEPLKGSRLGQRSIRLSRSYRAIYTIKKDNSIEFVNIEEVSKHEY